MFAGWVLAVDLVDTESAIGYHLTPKSYDYRLCNGCTVPAPAPAAEDTSTKEAQHDERG